MGDFVENSDFGIVVVPSAGGGATNTTSTQDQNTSASTSGISRDQSD